MSDVKREKFVRLLNARMSRVSNTLRLIGNLGSEQFYEYADEDIDLIHDRLVRSIASTMVKFKRGTRKYETPEHMPQKDGHLGKVINF